MSSLLIDAPRNCNISEKGEEYVLGQMTSVFAYPYIDRIYAVGKPRWEPTIVRRIANYHKINMFCRLKSDSPGIGNYFHRDCWDLANHLFGALFLFERGDWRLHAMVMHCLRRNLVIRSWDLDNDCEITLTIWRNELFAANWEAPSSEKIIPSWPKKIKRVKRHPTQKVTLFS